MTLNETIAPTLPDPPASGGPHNEKARRILDGARSAFQELGYEGTSVDEIARRAGVSKPTLYSYFGDKQALFAASFSNECQTYAETALGCADFEKAACVVSGLSEVAHQFVAFLVSPAAQSMFRSAVAESGRFPELGRAYYASGPERLVHRFKDLLERAVAGGVLAIDDLNLAAHQLMALCQTELFLKQLLGVASPSEADIKRVAKGAVKMFFDGYRKRD